MIKLIRIPPGLLAIVALGISLVFAPSDGGVTPLSTRLYVDYRPTATVLTLEGSGILPGVSPSWNDSVLGPLCQNADTCTAVDYQSWNPSIPLAVIDGVLALDEALDDTSGEKIVLGYSLGALVVSAWLARSTLDPNAPDPNETTFVTMGNLLNARGGLFEPLGRLLPESQYHHTEVIRQYDPLADGRFNPFNVVTLLNAVAGLLFIHYDYSEVEIDAPGNVTWSEGNNTYVFVPTDEVPILEPLRLLGLNGLADKLNDPLKAVVESGYFRVAETEAVVSSNEVVPSNEDAESGDAVAVSNPMVEFRPISALWRSERLDAAAEKTERLAQAVAAKVGQLAPSVRNGQGQPSMGEGHEGLLSSREMDIQAKSEPPFAADRLPSRSGPRVPFEGARGSQKRNPLPEIVTSVGKKPERRDLGKKHISSRGVPAGATKAVRDRISSGIAKVGDNAKSSPRTDAKGGAKTAVRAGPKTDPKDGANRGSTGDGTRDGNHRKAGKAAN